MGNFKPILTLFGLSRSLLLALWTDDEWSAMRIMHSHSGPLKGTSTLVSETGNFVSRNKIACFGNKCGQALIMYYQASQNSGKMLTEMDCSTVVNAVRRSYHK